MKNVHVFGNVTLQSFSEKPGLKLSGYSIKSFIYFKYILTFSI